MYKYEILFDIDRLQNFSNVDKRNENVGLSKAIFLLFHLNAEFENPNFEYTFTLQTFWLKA